MKANKRLALATLTAATTFGAVAGTAVGADTSTDVTFTVAAASSGLAITVGGGNPDVSLGSVDYNATTAQGVVASMNAVTIDDGRGTDGANWSLDVAGTDFGSVGAANGVAFLPVTGGLATAAVEALTAPLTLPTAPLATFPVGSPMLATGCVCGATGTIADGAAWINLVDLGTSYTLIEGTSAPLLGTPTLTLTPSVYVEIPAGTLAGNYTSTVTFTLS